MRKTLLDIILLKKLYGALPDKSENLNIVSWNFLCKKEKEPVTGKEIVIQYISE
jgi:hypothetical protein